jgi:predicted peptidase
MLLTDTGARESSQVNRVSFSASDGSTQIAEVHYLLYLPREYREDDGKSWPLVLFLHGSSERGDDPTLLKRQGLPKNLESGADLPCIVVSPQCSVDQYWWPQTHLLEAFLDQMLSIYPIDARRVYLTGISMGGYGVWALAMAYPQRFAALVPIAGGADYDGDDIPASICNLKDLPVWAFHGKLDNNVPYSESVNAVESLRKCGGEPRMTLYPESDHADAWNRAYADPELWAWLLQQERP